MPRRHYPPKREVLPDPVYNSQLVTRFINSVLRSGKKSVAERIFYGALDLIQQRTQDDPLKVFKRAVDNIKPQVEVKSRRVGGSTYQVPVEVPPGRQLSLAIRWLIDYAKARGEKSMTERMAGEFLDAANNRGGAMKKKDDTHRMAEANKAFSHYRW
jgi:small subunit ribosomal protein S7